MDGEKLLTMVLYFSGCGKYCTAYLLHQRGSLRLSLLLPGALGTAAVTLCSARGLLLEKEVRLLLHAFILLTIFLMMQEGLPRRITETIILFFAVGSLTRFFGILIFGLGMANLLSNREKLTADLCALGAFFAYGWIRRSLRRVSCRGLKKLLPPLMMLVAAIMMAAMEGIAVYGPASGGKREPLLFAWIMSLLGMLAVMVSVWVAVYLFRSNDQLRERVKQGHSFILQQQKHCALLEEQDKETRRLRHDMKHHLLCLESFLMAEGDFSGETGTGSPGEAEEAAILSEHYLASLYQKLKKIGEGRYHTGHLVTDVLTNAYLLGLEGKIQVEIQGELERGFIDDEDLCTIYGNLICNAAEELERRGGGKLRITLHSGRIRSTLIIENSSDTVGLFTKKKNRRNHGLGLQNVRDCVRRCGGRICLSSSGGWFRAVVTLPDQRAMSRMTSPTYMVWGSPVG